MFEKNLNISSIAFSFFQVQEWWVYRWKKMITPCGTSGETSSKLDKLTNQTSVIRNTRRRGKNTETSAWPGQEADSVSLLKDFTSNQAVCPPSPDNFWPCCQTPTGLTEGQVPQKRIFEWRHCLSPVLWHGWRQGPGSAELLLSCLSDTDLSCYQTHSSEPTCPAQPREGAEVML